MYTLYFAPGTCALSLHIMLLELGLPFRLARVDLRAKKTEDGADFLAIHAKGYVPALTIPSGETLGETAVTLEFLADTAPSAGWMPPSGTFARVRMRELLVFIATELHKGASPFYNPAASEALKASLLERLTQRHRILDAQLGDGPFLTGATFTVADAYAFYVLRTWKHILKAPFVSERIAAYYDRLAERSHVRTALEAQGLVA